ncbi:hypothetical protein KIL84_014423 [Mauremys mutica]|uniref:EF-hand domain-containing protein n=1 Tax=Mauremys mutica TaxID=74926 RepID=A0A9D4B0R3_9SAUR|nr:hypothetical protein KIL84_014423 [Mauremys mutica]
MAKFLSQDQINEFKECFSLYDKKQQGKINASDLITVMRCLGTSPTPGEVDRHLQGHKIDRKAELDFSTFLTIMYRQMQQEDPEKEILAALAMTDKQKKGFITASELRAKLTRLGEKLSDDEGTASNGSIRSTPFLTSLLSPHPSLTGVRYEITNTCGWVPCHLPPPVIFTLEGLGHTVHGRAKSQGVTIQSRHSVPTLRREVCIMTLCCHNSRSSH